MPVDGIDSSSDSNLHTINLKLKVTGKEDYYL